MSNILAMVARKNTSDILVILVKAFKSIGVQYVIFRETLPGTYIP